MNETHVLLGILTLVLAVISWKIGYWLMRTSVGISIMNALLEWDAKRRLAREEEESKRENKTS